MVYSVAVKRALRLALLGLAALLLVSVAGGSLAALWLWSRLPQISGTLALPGLERPVEVIRDAWGVPHIYAESLTDLVFAQGFVTAQDRPWQMDLLRRAAAGRLAEVLGPEALAWDRLARTVGFERVARAALDRQEPEARRVLEAYARGVNAALARNPRALEFLLLRYRPEPWEPLHTLALGRLLAWELSQWGPRLVLARLLPRLDAARREGLIPVYPADGPVIVAGLGASAWPGLLGPSGGSNGWAVGTARSASGAPLLANDPHLPLGAPSRWYEVHLVGAGLDVYGFSIPGAPGVIIGANAELAWGFTNLMLDDLDLYRERLHPEREDLYEVAGRWEPLTVLMERIEVRGGEPETLEVRIGRHGPLITPTLIQAGEPLALRWTGHEPGQEVAALLGMNRARTWPEFREALRRFATPAQNVIYADRGGTIAYQAVGRIPVRPRGGSLLPLEGWHGRDDWRGWVPFDRLPRVVDPPAGVLVTANNRVSADPGLYISHLWEPPDRAARIRELLEAKAGLTLDDLREIQLDRRPPWVSRLVPLILEAWKDAEGSSEVAGGLDLLEAWDGALEPASPAAALFEATVEELLAQIFRDELGEDDYREFGRAWDLAGVVLDRLLERGTSPWFDDVTTPAREDLPELLRRSLRAALRGLEARLGPGPAGWRWDRLHTLALEHPLGRRRPLGLLFSLGPYGMGGDARTVWKSHFYHDGRFRAAVGPSFRMLVDLADRRRSRVVLTTGQSGHPLSRHYRDQTPLWLRGEDRPMLVERTAIEAAASGHLHLLPAE